MKWSLLIVLAYFKDSIMFKKYMLAAFVSAITLSSAHTSNNNNSPAIAGQPAQNLDELSLQAPQAKTVIITSPEEQYIKFSTLTKTRKPNAPFPELLPQFNENRLAIENVLQGGHLKVFQEICQHAQGFFGPNGQHLTLPSYNVAHLYFATLLGDYQRLSTVSGAGYMLKDEGQWFISCFRKALDTAMDTDFHSSSLFNRFDSSRIKPAMYVKHGLYPYTIVSPDGNLSIKDLMRSLAHKIRLCAMPLTISQFDGELEQTSDAFLAHDWGHASPDFNAIKTINENGLVCYQELLDLVEKNPNDKIRNLDYFCLFFIEHEKYSFHRVDVIDLEKTCDDILSTLLTNNLDVLHLSSFSIDGVTTMDVFKKFIPNKEEPFILKNDDIDKYSKELTVKIFNSNFQSGYNLLFDIRSLLKESDVDFEIWEGDKFNVDGITKILTEVFNGFKERYSGKL
jgi:hypothetical protein